MQAGSSSLYVKTTALAPGPLTSHTFEQNTTCIASNSKKRVYQLLFNVACVIGLNYKTASSCVLQRNIRNILLTSLQTWMDPTLQRSPPAQQDDSIIHSRGLRTVRVTTRAVSSACSRRAAHLSCHFTHFTYRTREASRQHACASKVLWRIEFARMPGHGYTH